MKALRHHRTRMWGWKTSRNQQPTSRALTPLGTRVQRGLKPLFPRSAASHHGGGDAAEIPSSSSSTADALPSTSGSTVLIHEPLFIDDDDYELDVPAAAFRYRATDDDDDYELNPLQPDPALASLRHRILAQPPLSTHIELPALPYASTSSQPSDASASVNGASRSGRPSGLRVAVDFSDGGREGGALSSGGEDELSAQQPGPDGLLPLPLASGHLPWSPSSSAGAKKAREAIGSFAEQSKIKMGEAQQSFQSTSHWVKDKSDEMRAECRKTSMELFGRILGEESEEWKEEWAAMKGQGFWPRCMWIWERPNIQKMRISLTLANLTIRMPALLAILFTQMSLIAGQVSLPMLAPVLLGTGIALKGIISNAQVIFPRIGLTVVFLWCLWFLNTALTSTIALLQRQGTIDARLSGALTTLTEVIVLTAAFVVVLSMLGVNVSGLLLPTAVVLAISCKDLVQNLLAGFFLFLVAPFKHGDTVTVPTSAPLQSPPAAAALGLTSAADTWQTTQQQATAGIGPTWFQGTCESVDLRYTVLRSGKRRLFMPNAAFISREFIVEDAPPQPPRARPTPNTAQRRSTQQLTAAPAAAAAAASAASLSSVDEEPAASAATPPLPSPGHLPTPVQSTAAASGPAAAAAAAAASGAAWVGVQGMPWGPAVLLPGGAEAGRNLNLLQTGPTSQTVVIMDQEAVRKVWASLGIDPPGAAAPPRPAPPHAPPHRGSSNGLNGHLP